MIDQHWTFDRQSQTPLYLQLYQQLRQAILQGAFGQQRRLPPGRQLAERLGLARITVSQAYDQLVAEGFVVRRPGAGTFIAHHLSLTKTNVELARPFQPTLSPWGRRVVGTAVPATPKQLKPEIDFGFGRAFPHIFPYDVWRKLLARYLSTDDVMLSRYGSVAGFFPLRQALADYLTRWRGVVCTAEQIVIVNGAQQALDILARLLLEPGEAVLVETPGYADAAALFRLNGARLTAVPVDDAGFCVDQIPAHSQARLAFVTPSNQFPHGGTLPLERRMALLHWAQQENALIIEDDYDGELRYDGRPLAALQGLSADERVIYLGTFSKVLFPALRLSYVVLPSALVRPFVQAKQLIDRGAPTLTQAAVADFMVEGHFERHLRHLRQAYGQRRQTLVTALQNHLNGLVKYADEPAGLHVMLYLPEGIAETAVVQAAAQVGVGVYAAAPYFMAHPSPPAILLGFSGLSEPEIAEGVARLGAVMGKLLG
ncbi:PLP-dependent aminotransferase family protein [Candidatus Leptofilum sp.]|uniref:MocR-like pyridoxine biosynthesis transcription factor PdxR n=1 Tax=Candidatus Leptofilum sp. TaxID=3241576 RepID=UPI003B5CAFC1